MSETRRFANAPGSVALARQFAVGSLVGVERDIVEAVTLMVSELATNSVRHTDTDFTVAIDRGTDRIRVEVTDRGSGRPTPRSPALHEPSGRGLRIVDSFADEWGIVEAPSGRGKTVWFTITISSPRQQSEGMSRRSASGHGGGAPIDATGIEISVDHFDDDRKSMRLDPRACFELVGVGHRYRVDG